ncbi:MAG: hypothetical protein ACWGO1_05115 [Anaerolineales bacterium]
MSGSLNISALDTSALVWAAVRSIGDKLVYTLDARFPGEGIGLLTGS